VYRLAAAVVCIALLVAGRTAAPRLLAQHESAGAIEEGRTIYGAVCANCHGPDGNLIGGIDFSRGQFRRPYSDQELGQIVRRGIPGTPMPPTEMPEAQTARVVAYLRSMSTGLRETTAAGDRGRGRALFEGKGTCQSCHMANGQGGRQGPDLSAIGAVRRAAELERSILDPAAEVLPQNRSFRVVTGDGRTIDGRLMNQDTFTVQILDSEGQLRSFDKTTLREHGFIETTMPSFRGKLDSRELADLVAYLTSLRRR
jgi:putative heme-binding domain-containing protein